MTGSEPQIKESFPSPLKMNQSRSHFKTQKKDHYSEGRSQNLQSPKPQILT